MNAKKGFLLTILSAVIFGIQPFLAHYVYDAGSNPILLCFHRFFFSLPFLLALAWRSTRGALWVSRRQLRQIALLSLGLAGTPLLLFCSYEYISSSMATTIHFVYPVLVLLGCAAVFREKITRIQGICCVLCVAGILCFYTPGTSGSTAGILLAFFSGMVYAFYVIYLSRSGLSEMDPYVLCLYTSAFGAGETLLASLLTHNLVLVLSPQALGVSVLLTLLVAVTATLCFQLGARWIGPQMVSMVSTFEPLTSVVVGVLLFHEALTPRSLAGVICILLAVILLAWRGSATSSGADTPAAASSRRAE